MNWRRYSMAVFGVLWAPERACRMAREQRRPAFVVALVMVVAAAIGGATLPRQQALLTQALEATGDVGIGLHHAMLLDGLMRVILLDRLLPPPGLMVAAVLLLVAAEPLVAAERASRREVVTVVALGLAPFMVQRVAELVVVLAASGQDLTPGLVFQLPRRAVFGPARLWTGVDPAPAWLEFLNARFNLVSLWCVGLWAIGLRQLEGRGRVWHLLLPVLVLVLGGLIVWRLTPAAFGLVLGPAG